MCAPISIAPAPKKAGEDQAIGRSRGGLSTKIHTLVDALGNPLGFFLTGGEAHDLVGADHLLPTMAADTLIADKAFDADERVLEPLAAAGKTAVIPPRANRSSLRDYDRSLYGERHLIENFFARIKQFRAIATRYEKTARNFLAAVQLVAGGPRTRGGLLGQRLVKADRTLIRGPVRYRCDQRHKANSESKSALPLILVRFRVTSAGLLFPSLVAFVGAHSASHSSATNCVPLSDKVTCNSTTCTVFQASAFFGGHRVTRKRQCSNGCQ